MSTGNPNDLTQQQQNVSPPNQSQPPQQQQTQSQDVKPNWGTFSAETTAQQVADDAAKAGEVGKSSEATQERMMFDRTLTSGQTGPKPESTDPVKQNTMQLARTNPSNKPNEAWKSGKAAKGLVTKPIAKQEEVLAHAKKARQLRHAENQTMRAKLIQHVLTMKF